MRYSPRQTAKSLAPLSVHSGIRLEKFSPESSGFDRVSTIFVFCFSGGKKLENDSKSRHRCWPTAARDWKNLGYHVFKKRLNRLDDFLKNYQRPYYIGKYTVLTFLTLFLVFFKFYFWIFFCWYYSIIYLLYRTVNLWGSHIRSSSPPLRSLTTSSKMITIFVW